MDMNKKLKHTNASTQ